MILIRTLFDAVLKSVRKHKGNRVAVVPEGPYVMLSTTPPTKPLTRQKKIDVQIKDLTELVVEAMG